jgi:UDP-N-acetylmuramoylalanine--D-glutamate ligase
MGLGLLGRGIGDARFLAEEGADEVLVTDLKSEDALAESVTQLKGLANIRFVLGEHRLEDFRNRNFILKAAGVPLDSPYIAEARTNGIPIEMSTSLFAAYTPAVLVGITGTRGKSTVTHLLQAIFSYHYRDSTSKVFLGGNVRGVSTLPFLRETRSGDAVILELDSWQLQGFGERKISPHLAVFTTFLPDHLNYYHGDVSLYFADKASIFSHQKPGDILVVGKQVAEHSLFKKYTATARPLAKIITAGEGDLPTHWKINLPGDHNRYNIGIARVAALAFDISDEAIRPAVEAFSGVPGRLEHIAKISRIDFYNDTTATTPDATLAALRSFPSDFRNIVLIMGGNDKNLDMSDLIQKIPQTVKSVILLPGSGTDRILLSLERAAHSDSAGDPVFSISRSATMSEAVDKAYREARKIGGESAIVLLSPGFASFGLFTNEFDRGEQFNLAVAEVQRHP